MRYYYIRIYNQKDGGRAIATRCEKAAGPREACQLAFGVVYDQPYHTARYLDLGGKSPKYLSQKRLKQMEDEGPWLPIPPLAAANKTKKEVEQFDPNI